MAIQNLDAEHARLQALVGEWSGTEVMHPSPWDPAGGSGTARIVNRAELEGLTVSQHYHLTRKGFPDFFGLGVFWYDPAAVQYVMSWWDSMGGIGGVFRGHFNGDVLELQNASPDGSYSRALFDMSRPGHYAFDLEISQDGETWMPCMEGDYRLAKSAGKAVARKAKTTNVKATKAKTTNVTTRTVAARKAAPQKAAPQKAAKKVVAKKVVARKVVARKAAVKKVVAKKVAAKKVPAKPAARAGKKAVKKSKSATKTSAKKAVGRRR